MTEKQEKILESALKLFAEQGYASISTSKIAKEAGVSEGLIFRHFKNKEGLLEAIMDLGKIETDKVFEKLKKMSDPTDVIQAVLSLPFNLEEKHHTFWKLLYSIKWQSDIYDASISTPFKEILIKAFKKLDYFKPEIEADLVLSILDGMNTMVLLRKPKNKEQIKQTLLKRYR